MSDAVLLALIGGIFSLLTAALAGWMSYLMARLQILKAEKTQPVEAKVEAKVEDVKKVPSVKEVQDV